MSRSDPPHGLSPRFESVPPMTLIGISARMSLASDQTAELWQELMRRRDEIEERLTDGYISMRIYQGTPLDELFAPETEFEKWAAVEVAHDAVPPDGMRSYQLNGGEYAVFTHRGRASRFSETMRYIFGNWLPASGRALDRREHFERIPKTWRPDDDNAEEEIYVPIR